MAEERVAGVSLCIAPSSPGSHMQNSWQVCPPDRLKSRPCRRL